MTLKLPDTPTSKRRNYALLSILPLLYCIVLTARYRYDTPYWDQWWNVEMVQMAFDGTLRIQDLWRLDNEHRVFFPNMLNVLMARLSHWNLAWESAASILFAVLTYLLIARALLRAEKDLAASGTLWVLPLIACMLFSFNQWRNWMWGLHLMIFMAAFFLVATVVLLGAKELSWPRFAAATLLAVLASYSFGSGIVVWPAGFILLLPGLVRRPRTGGPKAGLWVLAACATMAIYFIGYQATPASQDALNALASPLRYGAYILAYLGAPIFNYSPRLSLIAGTLGLVLLIVLTHTLIRKQAIAPHIPAPFLGMALLAIAIALLTGLKQSHEGIQQALSSRYITWPTLFWIALASLLYLATLASAERTPRKKNTLRAALAAWVVLILIACAFGSYRADEHHDGFLIGRHALLTGENEQDLRFLYPDIEFAKQQREILLQYNLSIFRK